jgi:hypothetical protein
MNDDNRMISSCEYINADIYGSCSPRLQRILTLSLPESTQVCMPMLFQGGIASRGGMITAGLLKSLEKGSTEDSS